MKLAVLALVPLLFTAPLAGRSASVEALAPDLVEDRTRALVARFGATDHWALRAIVLLTLGEHWHPVGAPMVLEALKSKDPQLRAFGVEALLRSHPRSLRCGASTSLLDQLILKGLRERDEYLRGRSLAACRAVFSRVGGQPTAGWEVADWRRWWNEARRDYEPLEWFAGALPESEGRSSSLAFVERAFDLEHDGLQLALCIDSTGSMQTLIDATAAASRDIALILHGVASDFEVSLVHYRDFGDDPHGAEVLVELTRDHERVQRALGEMKADGGGDTPERVELALEEALDPRQRWRRSANKVVILLGDAPPHPEVRAEAVELAREAHERPFGKPPMGLREDGTRKPGARYVVRPFVISTVAVGLGSILKETQESFREIADAGGGSYVEMIFGLYRALGEEEEDSAAAARTEVIQHILGLTFGGQHADAVADFVEIYLRYHERGSFE